MLLSKNGKRGLLASASSKELLEQAINDYFASDGSMRITDAGEIYSANREKTLENYIVYKKKDRWRFERILGE